jgi:hypothetical protein
MYVRDRRRELATPDLKVPLRVPPERMFRLKAETTDLGVRRVFRPGIHLEEILCALCALRVMYVRDRRRDLARPDLKVRPTTFRLKGCSA